jgi:hypothetical protein
MFCAFTDAVRHAARFTDAGANAPLTITDNDNRAEGEAAATLDDLRHALDIYHTFVEFFAFFVALPIIALLIVAFALLVIAATFAAAALAATGAVSSALWSISSHHSLLKIQAAIARAFCQGSHAAMIFVPAPVKNDLCDAGAFGAFGQHAAHDFGGFGFLFAGYLGGDFLVHRRGRHQRAPRPIIYHLGKNVARTAEDIQPGTFRRTFHPSPYSPVTAFPRSDFILCYAAHVFLF